VAKYSIDTSSILHGWRRHYPPEVFPALWKNLEKLIEDGDLIASEEVLHDLEKKDDEVYKWAKSQTGLFIQTDEAIQVAVQGILAQHKKLVDTRRNRSASDPFVIALGRIANCAVVADEQPGGGLDRPRIPDVCAAMGIRYMNLLALIREQKWVFRG
jgi:hypothetical protein